MISPAPRPRSHGSKSQTRRRRYRDDFGASVAVSGSTVAVGTSIPYPVPEGTSPEAVFVFDLAGAEPGVPRLVLHDPRPTRNNGFGEALALNGSQLIVGAPKNSSQAAQAGSAYLFDLASPTPTQPVQTFDQPGAVAQAYFGTRGRDRRPARRDRRAAQ